MTLTTIVLWTAFVALLLTLVVGFLFKKHKSWVMTYLQNFCGAFFIFSGMVKAVDPLGTAYKLEQYFDEFYSTFEPTWFGFLAPMFPFFAKYAVTISVIVVVFEIVLGLMLILGYKSKFTSWAFLLLVGFFTFLTGFTYLTGYVPAGANFFEFGKWAAYDANNMKVTDCGCFGDFIKLEPKTSFLKDVFLMIPALFFVFRHKDMHQLFTRAIRGGTVAAATVGLLVYCMSNYVWDLPHADFRPFQKDRDIRSVRQAEEDAMAAVKITHYRLKHRETGEEIVVEYNTYLKNYKTLYNKDTYEALEQIKDEPSLKPTKVSEFEITDLEGNDISYDFIDNPEPQFMIVNYMLKGDPQRKTRIVKDSLFTIDTVMIANEDKTIDTTIVKNFDRIQEREEEYIDQNFDASYIKTHVEELKPFTDAAKNSGIAVRMAVGKSDPNAIAQFDQETGLGIDYGMGDDILLKTIVRSNPGVVLWKDGKILDKWHINKLPDFNKVKEKYLN